ncbi:T9SS type A sorting domain-containing protein, partial [Tenacibaculum sp. 190524A02b]|uniref:T9SS type A sorting domain-containing protein n=1 Tax=Tenacibaculum vairaonense TaxID=3137860 RepID=UPI0032B1A00B
LDPGYDVGNFGGAAFDVFTRLVSGTNSQDFTLQSLPNANYEGMVIPLGIKSEAGEEVNISMNVENLPTGIEVYLEDRLQGIETKLSDKDAIYKVNFKEKIDGVGRFYLHTKSASLDVSEVNEKPVSIYATTTKHVIIEGVNGEDFTVEIFNTLGSKMIERNYKGTGKNSINVAGLSSGTYIVKLVSEKQTETKKIIIE